MSTHKYNYQKELNLEKTARASKHNMPISTKYSTEFSNYFKGKLLVRAIQICSDIEEKKDYLPLVKFNKKVPHRKGESKRQVMSGRYPVKAAGFVKKLLEEVKANAESKDLELNKLKIIHMFATHGVSRTKLQPMGRIGGKMRKSKSTDLEVIVLEE